MSSCTVTPGPSLRHIFLLLATVAITCFTQHLPAQTDSPIKANHIYSGADTGTVSANQLRISDKALRSVSRARQDIIDGKLDKAQKEIDKALHVSPDCAEAIDIQGLIHLHSGNLDQAANEFQRAIDGDPTIGQAYLGLGMVMISHKQFKAALIPLERAESLLPSSWLVYLQTAVADFQVGDMNATLQQLKYAERFAAPNADRQSQTAFMHAMVLIKLTDFTSAAKYLNDAIELSPGGTYAKSAQAKLDQLKPLLNSGNQSLAVNRPQP
jgi:tetratricopeptide (TPR) repeat protein